MAKASDALEMFLSDDQEKISLIAARLQEYNKQRRNIEGDILKEADSLVQQSFSSDQAIVVGQDGWHPGVLGIVASRLADKYWRPAFVISFDDKIGKGSGRSVAGVHLMDILDGCSMHLSAYGGHKKAAGIHIQKDQLEIFRLKVNQFIKEKVDPADMVPVLDIDGIVDFSDISMDLVDELERLKPFGEENAKPLFVSFKVSKKGQPQKNKAGYSLWLTAGGVTVEAAFYDKDMLDILSFGDTFDIAGNIEKNNYYNSPRISLKDVRIAG
jgi:single-stranded-DNA-specific exonuclease